MPTRGPRRRSSWALGPHNIVWCADYYNREDAQAKGRAMKADYPSRRYRITQLRPNCYELLVWNPQA